MRKPAYFIVSVLAVLTSACTERSLPVFFESTPMSIPAGQPAEGPRLSQGADGTVIVSWMERGDETASLRYSEYADGKWGPATHAVTDPEMFINWADLPGVLATGEDRRLAFWLSRIADAPYAYQILYAQSGDGGATWSEPLSPHNDGTPTEHGFVSTYPAAAGTGLVWLDGRETPDAGMTLRAAVVSDNGEIESGALLDDHVCDCCQTDVAITADGPLVVFRDRSEDEIRDIYAKRLIDGQWQPGVAIGSDGWEIAGCPVNGPAVAATDDFVAVAWFTAANEKAIVKTAYSSNAGTTFSTPIELSGKAPLGHVGVAIIDQHSYAVSWLEADQKDTYALKIRGLTSDGQVGPVSTVGRTALPHIVPQMRRAGDKLILAWTDEITGVRKVVSVKVPIAGFYD
tara:strand:+ start:2546 stop:3748 length:1203 start_codon:yes stop_codon:yes gene_type:complete